MGRCQTDGYVASLGRARRRIGAAGSAPPCSVRRLPTWSSRGSARASLSVDTENTTGAVGLYRERRAGADPRGARIRAGSRVRRVSRRVPAAGRPIARRRIGAAVAAVLRACDLHDVGIFDAPRSGFVDDCGGLDGIAGAWIVERGIGRRSARSPRSRPTTPRRTFDAFFPVLPRASRRRSRRRSSPSSRTRRERSERTRPRLLMTSRRPPRPAMFRRGDWAGFAHVRIFWHMQRALDRPSRRSSRRPASRIRPLVTRSDDDGSCWRVARGVVPRITSAMTR